MLALLTALLTQSPAVTFESLVTAMVDRSAIARWPAPEYRALQASSYNRESTHRDKPGWFADSDGVGFIRTEGSGSDKEYVLMEHSGPGCITKIWTPFFYYDFNERTGPNVRIYLDGSAKPVFDESLIKLVCGDGSISKPWAAYSARAGNLYLPIPFSRSAKVTMRKAPFYFKIDYRAYPAGTQVETFDSSTVASHQRLLNWASGQLSPIVGKSEGVPKHTSNEGTAPKAASTGQETDATHRAATPQWKAQTIAPGGALSFKLPEQAHAVDEFTVQIEGANARPELLRTTVLSAKFDGIESVWCPVGDFFCSPDAIHPFQTTTRMVDASGLMKSRWVMPYRETGEFQITNYGKTPVQVRFQVKIRPWNWDSRTMRFYARWRSDDVVPGSPFSDWNFVDISAKGVYVGDLWTVLNIRRDSWWGEGDEKIYVDDAWDKGFPTQFGTGTEDYYGWAGGVYPVKEDEFSAPFLSNVKVGGLDSHTLGYNISTRTRALDAIPFNDRLRFDMESSFGTDMREKWNLLGYSAVTFWYAFPGAKHNRPPDSAGATKPIMSVKQLEEMSDRIRKGGQ